jgi:hypothetical protein
MLLSKHKPLETVTVKLILPSIHRHSAKRALSQQEESHEKQRVRNQSQRKSLFAPVKKQALERIRKDGAPKNPKDLGCPWFGFVV